ncbi:hypothetical protein SDC9_160064 [bioreactor metagenome]|uniref:Uncharacterized protein n=1 Tax=bioreactor metagenome TaxID=1076179 RepID=A0A645FJZ1_9ZZZZ
MRFLFDLFSSIFCISLFIYGIANADSSFDIVLFSFCLSLITIGFLNSLFIRFKADEMITTKNGEIICYSFFRTFKVKNISNIVVKNKGTFSYFAIFENDKHVVSYSRFLIGKDLYGDLLDKVMLLSKV